MPNYSTDVPPEDSIYFGAIREAGDIESDEPFYTSDPAVLEMLNRRDEDEYWSSQESFSCPVCKTTSDFPGPCSKECYDVWNYIPDEPYHYGI